MWDPSPGDPVLVAAVIVCIAVALRVRLAELVWLGVDAAAFRGLLAHEFVVNHTFLPLDFLVRFGLLELQNKRVLWNGMEWGHRAEL